MLDSRPGREALGVPGVAQLADLCLPGGHRRQGPVV